MKRTTRILLAILCATVSLQAQKIILKGQVSIHNSQHETGSIQYVPNAQISADSAVPTLTDPKGQFDLHFIGLPSGSMVDLEVSKPEFEVVNDKDLKSVVLGRKSSVKVFLAPAGRLAEAQAELYNISLSALTNNHKKWIDQLRMGGESSKALIADLEQRLSREFQNRFEVEEVLNDQLEKS